MLRLLFPSVASARALGGGRSVPALRCVASALPDGSGARVAIVGSGPSGFYTAK